MTASTLKGAIKGTLKGILNTAAPVFSRRSAMDSASARETLLGFSPPPTGTAAADNRLLEPECDLQIVIPAYNVEAYLAQCMDSVLAQETKYTYRVILVDDGATDTTPAIADTYSDDPRVTVIHQRNKGLSGARNTGIREIFGKYLMFIDSDDFLLPGAIDAMLDTAFAHDCDLVEGGAYYVYDNMGKPSCTATSPTTRYPTPTRTHGHAWGKLYRGALFEHLCFPEGYWYEDSLLSYLIFPNVRQAWVTEHMAYGYRINQAGIVKSSHGKPKSVDTYWITEELMAEHAQAGLPADDAYFRYILLQIRLNQHRIADLPEEIQESVFVLTCDLFCNTFPADLDVSGNRTLIKALRTRDFGMYKMCCRLF
ncbi:MAG: glycosyltransferase [Oscillospiraceae bacterium]